MKKFIVLAALAAALAIPASAQASYSISQNTAEANVRDAAEYKYGDLYGVTVDVEYCRPQGLPSNSVSKRYYGVYLHRWTCIWVGTDSDGADVGGAFRITGHSNGNYGYLPVGGGIRWM